MSQERAKQREGFKKVLISLSVMFLLVGIFSFGPQVQQVAAVTCRNIVNPAEQGRTTDYSITPPLTYSWTKQYIVPSPPTSYCQDINVTNITDASNNTHCGAFRVRFYPTSGGNYPTNWMYNVCSFPPNGPVIGIALSVLNGTKYRMEWQPLTNPNPYTFTIRD